MRKRKGIRGLKKKVGKFSLKGGLSRISRRQGVTYLIVALGVMMILGIAFRGYLKNDDVEDVIGQYKITKNPQNKAALGISPVKTFNPLVSKDEDTYYLSKIIYSSLFTFDENMTPKEDLVESYRFSGRTVKITVKNAQWEDGRSVSADDVAFTLKAIKSIGDNGPYGSVAKKIKRISYGSGGDRTFTVHFNSGYDMSLAYLHFPILPKHKYSGVDALKRDTENFVPWSSGLYHCSTYDELKGMKLTVNDKYYGVKAKSNIDVKIVKNGGSKDNLVASGNISALVDKSPERAGNIHKRGIKIHNFRSNNVEFIGFNTKDAAVKSVEMRKAIAYCTDIESIIEENYYNSAKGSRSIYPHDYMNSPNQLEYSFSKDRANDVLKKAGYSDKNSSGSIEDKDGNKVTLKILVEKDKERRIKTAERISKALKEIGINSEIVSVKRDVFLSKLRARDYSIYIGGLSLDGAMDMSSILKSDGENNFTGYSNRKVDGLLDELMSGKTVDESRKVLDELKKNIHEDLPYYCICYPTYGIVKAPVFNGELKSNFMNPYNGAETWYSNYEKRVETPKE